MKCHKNIISRYSISIVILLLSGMMFLEFTSVLKESQTVDEGVHLASGYSYLKTGDFRLNPEHPPLLKELSALPLLLLPLELPIKHESWEDYNQWEFARQFLYHNTLDPDLILLLGRIPTMILSLILGIFIYKWINKLWGSKAAIFALGLYVFEPNILAHSRYVTTDLALTLFFFLTIYFFDKFLKTYSRYHLILLALVFGFAQTVKFSALILFPLLLIFLFLKKFHSSSNTLSIPKIILILFIIAITTVIQILLIYGFETKIPINDRGVLNFYDKQLAITDFSEYSTEPPLVEKFYRITHPSTSTGALLYSLAQKIPLPAFSYFKGLGNLFIHNYWGHMSYLFGNYSNFGFWYYFPATFFLKTSVPLLLLIIIGICYFIYREIANTFKIPNRRLILTNLIKLKSIKKIKNSCGEKIKNLFNFFRSTPFSYWLLILTPLLYFFWAMTSRINIGHRHLLPIYPFLIILAGRIATLKLKKLNLVWQGLLIIFLIFYISSTLLIYPHFLAYFNELVGGPEKGPKYLVDSNIDWGQDLLKLKSYLQKNNITEIHLAYLGSLDINYYGLNRKSIPKDNEREAIKNFNGVVAISVTVLYNESRPYQWLEKLTPDEKIGYSIYLYDLRK